MNKHIIVLSIVFFISLSLAQTENWVYTYNGPGNLEDAAYSIIYGTDGNIYTAGKSEGSGGVVISLTPAGDTNWVYHYQDPDSYYARSIVYGTDGNIYAAGRRFYVVSLTTAGDTNWVYQHSGWAVQSLVYGGDDNIYAAGSSVSALTVLSLTPAGDSNWVYTYNGGGSGNAYSVVYGADGNIYVAGSSAGTETTEVFTVISLTPAGDTNWVYLYGQLPTFGAARSIVYGADGNLYVAGNTSGTWQDFTVISLTTAGDTNWVYRYNGPANWDDVARCVVYGTDGNIYAAGRSMGIGDDFVVISLTTAGDTNWVYTYNGPGNYEDASSLVYGADGNIYAAGYSVGSGTQRDFMVISLTPAGETNWIYQYNGPENGNDGASSIVYGADGNIYVAGKSYHSGIWADFTVISLPPDLGVKEKDAIVRERSFGASIFCGPIHLPRNKNCRVFDITGRVITADKIEPGIYFIEIDGVISQKAIKIK